MGRARLLEDLRQRRLGGVRVHAAQHVVGAEFDDQRVRARRHAPIVAREPVGRGVAGDAGVDDLDVPAAAFERALEDVGKRLARRQSVAGGQAVAERDDAQRPRLGRRGGETERRRERQGENLDADARMPI